MATEEDVALFIDNLPTLSSTDIASLDDDACAICLISFTSLLSSESSSSEGTSTGHAPEPPLGGGVTKLPSCGHVFCRDDLVTWITSRRGTCPTCRDPFLELVIPEDDESSDGGEYIPTLNEDEDEEEFDDFDSDMDDWGDDVDMDMDMEDWASDEDGLHSEAEYDDIQIAQSAIQTEQQVELETGNTNPGEDSPLDSGDSEDEPK